LTSASARKAETLVLAFLRAEGQAATAPRREGVLHKDAAAEDRRA
jgi:hypothetical protein